MKIIARLDNGQLLLAVSKEFPEQMQVLARQTRELADTVAFLNAITIVQDEQPATEPVPDTTRVEKPHPALKVKPAAKAPKTEPKTSTGSAYNRPDTMAFVMRSIMADGTPRTIDELLPLVEEKAPQFKSTTLRTKIGMCLATDKKSFERTAPATYRAKGTAQSTPPKAKPAAKAKAVATPAPLPFDKELLNADPKTLTDEQIKARMMMRKARGEGDKPACLEYMVRKQVG